MPSGCVQKGRSSRSLRPRCQLPLSTPGNWKRDPCCSSRKCPHGGLFSGCLCPCRSAPWPSARCLNFLCQHLPALKKNKNAEKPALLFLLHHQCFLSVFLSSFHAPLVTASDGVTVGEGVGGGCYSEKRISQESSGWGGGKHPPGLMHPGPPPAYCASCLRRRVIDLVCANIKLINEICMLKQW